MKNYTDSFYAKNKYSPNIVYISDDGTSIEITVEIYLKENPTHTVEDFQRLKELSDEIYHQQVNDENLQTRKNFSMHLFEESIECALPSPEDIHILEEDKKAIWELLSYLLDTGKITYKQLRRFLLYALEDKKMSDIAREENVKAQSVSESIRRLRRCFIKHYKDR